MQTFETKAQAVEHAKTCGFDQLDHRTFTTSGTYILSHGEMDRPDIIVQKYKNGWGFAYKPYFFKGTAYAPKRERANISKGQNITTASELDGYCDHLYMV